MRDGLVKKRLPIAFFSIAAAILLMFFLEWAISEKQSEFVRVGSFTDISSDFRDEYGKTINFDNQKLYNKKTNAMADSYFRLPVKMERNMDFIFCSRNAETQVWIGEKEIYKTSLSETFGIKWNFVEIDPKYRGQVIRISVKDNYGDGRAKIDSLYLGDGGAIILTIIMKGLSSVILCLLIFAAGIFFFVAGLVFNISARDKKLDLIYLGAFSVLIGIWGILETGVPQLFYTESRYMQILGYLAFFMSGITLFFYMDAIRGIFKHRPIRLFCMISIAYFLAATVLQFADILDYRQMLTGMVLIYIGIVGIMFCYMTHHAVKKGLKAFSGDFNYIMTMIGIFSFGAAVIIDFVRYFTGTRVDYALFTRIGLPVFIMFFGVGNMYQMISLIKQGLRSDIISKLAYSDGLTGVGNRTAYIEKIQELIEKKKSIKIGIVMFDINYLKETNDQQGHSFGDLLIRTAVSVLKQTFGNAGRIYRVGGDEFIAIIEGDDPKGVYEQVLPYFLREMEFRNKKTNFNYGVSLAYGIAVCENLTSEEISRTEREADEAMYRQKRRMKEHDRRMREKENKE